MKKLYLIGGTMGVGKTTACQLLKKKLDDAVFLDGDWCWDADPFQVNNETKRMVLDNICYLLNNFIHCSVYKNIIFCWVMHEQSIIDDILTRIDLSDCEVQCVSLVITPNALRERIHRDVESGLRQPDVLERSIERLPLYDALDTIKLNTSHMTPVEVADAIAAL